VRNIAKCLLRLIALCCVVPAAPQDDVVFRSGVSLVRVDAEVQDARGRLLTDLKKDDLRVLDEGAQQSIVTFSFEEEPLDLILLFDIAGSMRGKLLEVFRAVELGFGELHPGDRVCVMAFGGQAMEIAPFSSSLDAVNEAIVLKVPPLHFGGDWKPDRAADDAALRFRREPVTHRRRAVLIITDRVGARASGDAAAIRDLWQSDAVLSELVLGGGQQIRILESGASMIADKTGGATIVAGAPGPAFQDSVRRLRRRYTMYYALPAATPGSERSIQVELTPAALSRFPNSRVRARTGYVVQAK
jgi:VWFA-related protein